MIEINNPNYRFPIVLSGRVRENLEQRGGKYVMRTRNDSFSQVDDSDFLFSKKLNRQFPYTMHHKHLVT